MVHDYANKVFLRGLEGAFAPDRHAINVVQIGQAFKGVEGGIVPIVQNMKSIPGGSHGAGRMASEFEIPALKGLIVVAEDRDAQENILARSVPKTVVPSLL